MARRITRDGAIFLSTRGSAADFGASPADLENLGSEGYLIRSLKVNGHRATPIAANSNVGMLYVVFAFLRLMQTRQPLKALNLQESRH